jgi:hypothetical protein
MPLHPDETNEMFGRGGFYIHGDNPHHPGWSSDGCIIMAHVIREQIDADSDRRLTVTW